MKEACKSIANTIIVVNTLVGMQEGMGETYFKDICVEMERLVIACVGCFPPSGYLTVWLQIPQRHIARTDRY